MALNPFPFDADVLVSLAAIVLRLALGFLMVPHGWPKVKDLRGTAGFVRGTGWTWATAFVPPIALLELVGGLAIVLGFLTRIVALLFAVEMVATTVFAKRKLGKELTGGYEMDLLYLGIALALAFLGAGAWSLDAVLGL